MDIKTKHRVIGIVVLVALAVIIIPLFFGRSPEKGPRLASNIPSAPSKPQVQLTIPPSSQSTAASAAPLAVQPLQPVDASSMPGENIAPAVEETSATPPDSTTPEATQNSTPHVPKLRHEVPRTKTGAAKKKLAKLEVKKSSAKHHSEIKLAAAAKAWTVQLASFNQRANAQQLIKQLRAKGFAAYIHEAKTKQSLVCRVFVGPELNREKADVLAQKLHNEFHLKGVVVKYRV